MQYPSTQDFITKYARDEGTAHGYWSVVGTRVHRKCYLQALCDSGYAYDPQLLQVGSMSDFRTQAVCLQNECVGTQGKLEPDVLSDMYERVFEWERGAPGCPDAVLLEDFTKNMMAVAKHAVGDYIPRRHCTVARIPCLLAIRTLQQEGIAHRPRVRDPHRPATRRHKQGRSHYRVRNCWSSSTRPGWRSAHTAARSTN